MEEAILSQSEVDSTRVNKTAKKLHNKYYKERKVNEKLLKQKTPLQKVFSAVIDVLSILLVLFSAVICFSSINCKVQGTHPSFFSYSNLIVSSGSMRASGFEVGDTVVVKKVNTNTLKPGDKIAFYAYTPVNKTFDINSCEQVDTSDITSLEWEKFSLKTMLGFQSKKIVAASRAGVSIIFHHIKEVYTDSSGHRWFVTYGSSNAEDDLSLFGYVQDSLVIGAYTNNGAAKTASLIIKSMSTGFGIAIIFIPILFMALIIILESVRDVQKAKLECDCVEEKRKITDPICLKYEIGFNMSNKTKYKILAQVKEEDRYEYLQYLWKDGSAPNSIKKYIVRKELLLKANKALLDLNRECQNMFANNEKPEKIATYYIKEKEKIEKEQLKRQRELRKLSRKYSAEV